MGRDRRFPQRLIRWMYVCVCAALILLCFVFTPLANFRNDSTAAANAPLSPMPEGNGYMYSRSITIDHTKVPTTDQSNFPLLISGTYSYLASVANGGNVQNSNGYDVIFTSDSGCATQLNHEVESYNAGTGAVNYWVKVPTVSHTTDTSIYMCYGNSTVTTDQSNKSAVWDANYKGVWHLGNGNSLNVTDSTNNLNSTNQGATAVNGKVGGAASFDGSSQCISIGTIALTSNLTMEFWSYRTGGNVFEVLFDTGWNSTDGFCAFIRPPPPTNGSWHGFVKQAVMAIDWNTAAVDNTWEHVVWTVDSDLKPRLYVNGTLVFTSSDAAALVSQTHGGAIGCRLDSSGNRNANFQGYLDEVRLSNVVRSADRIATEHNNQSSPATFYTISSSGSSAYTYRRSITIDHTKVPNTDRSNFPLLISGTYSYLATAANGGNVQNSNGYDVIFTSDSGCANQLNHEVESYNASTGAVNYWVKVPTVSHTTDTSIYMCYGNSTVTTNQSNKSAVWDANYKGVWHLGNGTTLSVGDSTNQLNGTNHSAGAISGKVAGGAGFDGSSQYVSMPSTSLTSLITIEFWMARTGTVDVRATPISFGRDGTDGFDAEATSTTHKFTKSGVIRVDSGIAVSGVGVWDHIVWTVDSDLKPRLYVNGSLAFTSTDTQAITATTHGAYLGATEDTAGAIFRYALIQLDEVRLSNTVRSADWIATEYNNQSSPTAFYTISAAINQPPVANAGGPYTSPTGTAVNFSGISSSDPDGTIGSYLWNFGDSNSGSGATPTHAYSTAGTYTVTLTVTDNLGATNTASTTATISNRSPVANAGGPYTGITGTAVQFNGNSSSDLDGTIASYSWNFGDSNSGSGATPTHAYSTAGTYTVTLTVTDNLGATNTASTTATISNRPPVANAGGAYTGITGTAVQMSGGSSSDPDGTISSYAWNFGDSNTGTGVTPTHTYATAGTYTLSLTVTDNLGATNSASTTATIANRPPVANAGGPYTGTTGTAMQFSGNSSSDPDGTIASYSWNFGDSNSGSGPTPTHTYATAGTYTVTLTVTDNLGATASATATTTVTGTLDARLDPLNRTGGGGEDPLSLNFNWSIPLVSLPGRSGLDLGLSLAYNSLATWTRNGNVISFDDDHGSPAPGFRLGFPVIQGNFYNSQAGKYSFIMITPSGSRLELRQVGTSTKYQSVDSSYLLLDATNMKLLTSDGSQLSYAWKGSDYQCTEIKDRNGNFITINYDGLGRVDTVKDTLSRTITFNYDTNGSLSTIMQSWTVNGQTLVHPWATFAYTDKQIQTNFTNLTVYGPSNNSTIHALTQVKLADDSHFDFDYTSWGQIWKISQYTGETPAHLLNYRSYDLPMTAGAPFAQTDCPRFTARHDWAENWNRDANGAAQEVNTNFALPVDAALPDNSLATVTRTQVTSADGTYQQIYFAGSINGGAGSAPAWKRGLPLLTDTFDSNNTRQRSATTTWTQDDTSIAYQLNPRVTETNFTDPAGNHARTSIDYAATTLSDGTTVNLPQNTYEYQADASTILRRTHVDYNLTSAYTSRRIIGLVSEQTLYGGPIGSETLMSKVSYQYDESGSIQGTDAPVQHDNTNYSASLVAGRGNVSSVKRYDVNNTSQFTASALQYNTAGAVVATFDPLNHGVTVSYADSFSDDNNSRNTLAYPTTVTDAGGFSSSTKYNYDFGGATRKQTPLPNVTDNEAGPVQTIEYDSIGRLQKVKNLFNNAYTRYEYPASQTRVDTYATIQDNAGEAHSFKITDGHGRVIASAADHPGSTGGYSGQLINYDTMGRVIKQSNPTETSASSTSPYDWAATGDDATSNGGTGWVYTHQTYDWKGRPLVTTNTDTTYKSASYGGCGCAGSQVITLTDEVNRQQKIYSDVLGRQLKTEVLNADLTIYATTTNTFNARDQVTLVRQYQGADTSTVYQDTIMSYDGYGRLLTQHGPEQQVDPNNSLSTDHTTWTYNDDDTLHAVTDARGAAATYAYNNRHLVTGITFSAPAGITPTSSVSFAYDEVGNRTSMNDGLGSQTYSYNQLSQLMTETRTFNGVGTFTLSYDYNLAGELKKITDATNTTINYGYDNIGRLNGVTGSDNLVGGVSNYASGFQYRAWGSLKQISAGASHTASFGYNARLQANHFDISGGVVNQNYDYFNDGRLSFVHNTTDNNFDRAYTYDHAGRLTAAATGGEARHDLGAVPMYETFAYNAWDNTTTRVSESWLNDFYDSGSYTNGRRSGWGYDADGRIRSIDTRSYTNDASGRNTFLTGQRWTPSGYVPTSTTSDFDGDGKRIRETSDSFGYATTTYYLRSSVLGGVIVEELNSSGQKQLGYVFTPAAGLLATQVPGNTYVSLKQVSPIGASQYEFSFGSTMSESVIRREFDPAGANVQLNNHTSLGHSGAAGDISGGGGGSDSRFGALENPGAGCVLDGVFVPCSMAYRVLGAGAARECPNNDCSPRRVDIDIKTRGGDPQHFQGFLTDPFLLPDGFTHTWTGIAAREAFRAYNDGLVDGFQGAVVVGVQAAQNFENRDRSLNNHASYFAGPQNPAQTQTPNPNCIANAVAGGRVGDTRNIIPGAHGGNAHDGIHVEAGPGIHPVTALPAMAGGVLHAGPQDIAGSIGHNFSVVDILLNTRIDGQRYVMTLKDMGYDTGIRSGRVIPGRTIGSVEGSANPVGETGLHVTLMPLSVYNQYINGRFTGSSRSSVPVNQLMDAARDPRSPFRCP